jgi:hypothetical protein
MAWTVSWNDLVEGVSEARNRVEEHRSWRTLELLARGLRWVDQLAESRAVFHEAALDVIERIEKRARGNGRSRSRTAGFFALAGESEAAREWGLRAIDDLVRRRDVSGEVRLDELVRRGASDAAATLYVCGEHGRALALAREHGVKDLATELIEVEQAADRDRCDAAIGGLVAGIVSDRVAPFNASGVYPIDRWDWLETCFEVRARIAGEPVPSHAVMLERAGLLGPGPSRRVVKPEPGGVDRFAVTAADGTPIEASVDRRDTDLIEIVLDPRKGRRYLDLRFLWTNDAQGYRIDLHTDALSSPQDTLPYEGPDFREAVDAAADWLRSLGADAYGRDGAWATRTLIQVTKDLPVIER